MSFFTLSGLITTIRNAVGAPSADSVSEMVEALVDDRLSEIRADALDELQGKLDAKVSVSKGGVRRLVRLTSGSVWNHPTNVKDNFIEVTLVAAGGAGGRQNVAGCGGSGAGGGEVLLQVPLFISGGSTSFSVGQATAGRATDGAGSNGANTLFGSLTALGGKGGGYVASAAVDNPGGLGGGTLTMGWRVKGGDGGDGDGTDGSGAGEAGDPCLASGGAAAALSGGGGASWGAGGAANDSGSASAGVDGGGGGGCRSGTSGPGGAGMILIEYEEA